MVSNLIDQNEDLRTKIKSASLEFISTSVNLKDINFPDIQKSLIDMEKLSLKLMSFLDIACISGLISKMNANILKSEFKIFLSELKGFSEQFKNTESDSVKNIFNDSKILNINKGDTYKNEQVSSVEIKKENGLKNGNGKSNGYKRKDLRKNMLVDFIKGHNDASIKDIVPNIHGCSEKTIQRELLNLINEGKIKKIGERRWSRYSII
jgi:hypothetical protein